MTKAWVLHGECGDYYCGCGESHLIGVTLNYDLVDGLKRAALGIKHTYGDPAKPGVAWYADYMSVDVTELELDLVYPRNLGNVTHNTQNTDRTQGNGESLGT